MMRQNTVNFETGEMNLEVKAASVHFELPAPGWRFLLSPAAGGAASTFCLTFS
jgi:hypothetical protein